MYSHSTGPEIQDKLLMKRLGVFWTPLLDAQLTNTFEFPFCQRLWALTKHQDNILVANMEVDIVAEMEVDMVADINIIINININIDINIDINTNIDININMEIQLGKRDGHRGWLIGPKLFDPKLFLSIF